MSRPLNGANLVVRHGKNQILIVQANYGEKKLLLPGGGQERGETLKQTAQRELLEETGLSICTGDLREIAKFIQLVRVGEKFVDGELCLYETRRFRGSLFSSETDEILMSRFMDIEEVVERQSEFGLGYRRMIFQYLRCISLIDPLPFSGRLSTTVECPSWVKSKPFVLLS